MATLMKNSRCSCLKFILFLPLVKIMESSEKIQTKGSFDFCYNATLQGFRLNAVILKSIRVSSSTECIVQCVEEPCCRSVNYRESSADRKQERCEMLHEVVYNTSNVLRSNWCFNHIYLIEPHKEYNKSCIPKGSNCAELHEKGIEQSGVYTIDPDGKGTFEVLCDMKTSSGGWTVFQRRLDGSVEFHKGWKDYRDGFGDLNGEFWLGLEKIHRLTKAVAQQNDLRIDLEDISGDRAFAIYSSFNVGDETSKYLLHLECYRTGNANDSLEELKGLPFSTTDVDNVGHWSTCDIQMGGGWWYGKNCSENSNLNGIYYQDSGDVQQNGIKWDSWKEGSKVLKSTSMKLRPASFST